MEDALFTNGKTVTGIVRIGDVDVRYSMNMHSSSMHPYGKHIGWYNHGYLTLPDCLSAVWYSQSDTPMLTHYIEKYHVKLTGDEYVLNTWKKECTIEDAVIDLYTEYLDRGTVYVYEHKYGFGYNRYEDHPQDGAVYVK